MARYRKMTDPGYKSPFLTVIPGIPASMEPDREPEYEYKDELDEDDVIWEWEKCEDEEYDIWVEYSDGWYSKKAFRDPDADADFPDDYHKAWRDDERDDDDTPDPINDGMWHLALWMAGISIVLILLWRLILSPATV